MSNETGRSKVYIDEAGDLGIKRGTQWFVLTAVVVNEEDERSIRDKINQIKNRLNLHTIHMRNIRDFNKRGYVVRELNGERFTYMNVLCDTSLFNQAKIPTANIAYNYLCKYLLQRVSWFLKQNGRVGDVVLSARGTNRDAELIDYINDKLLPYPYNHIDPTHIGKVSAKAASQWDLLQLADICATTLYWAYTTDDYGFCTPCFALAMRKHLFTHNGKVESAGIKFFRREMRPDLHELRTKRICAY